MAPPPKKLKVIHSDNPSPANDGVDDANATEPAADIAGQRTIFVRSLNYSTTTESLSAHFSYIAPLKHATVVIDPATKASRGFGFVTFTDPADALKAVRECDGKLFEGRHIKVEIAQARHRDNEKTTGTTSEGAAVPERKKKGNSSDGTEVKKRNPRLIVRNLPWSVKKPEHLIKHFERFGKVKEVIIPRKGGSKHGPMSGFAFVTLKKIESARKAIEAVNGTEIEGRTIAVDWAVEKGEWQQQVGEGADNQDQDEDSDDDGEEVDGPEATEGLDTSDHSDSDAASDPGSDEDEALDNSEDESMMDADSSKPAISNDTVIFIRNLAFTTDEDALYEHFRDNFGPVRYARVVLEPDTGRPRGTAFVCFYREEDIDACLESAPKNTVQTVPSGGKDHKANSKQSVLQSESLDPTGKYTLDGRVLAISRAPAVGTVARERTKSEKRRLYLLQEGQIAQNNPLYRKLSAADIKMREDSYKQRKTFLEKNTSLHLSLTRLSVRNIPRNITEKDLKMLARQAVVGFAREVKEGKRDGINKEETHRGGIEAKEEEAKRRAKGKGVIRQAKIVREKDGAGRSMGYGFIEYIGHRWALMGLRWLNGREVAHLPAEEAKKEAEKDKGGKTDLLDVTPEDRKRRLIVEFALENVQVVQRRHERELAAKGKLPRRKQADKEEEQPAQNSRDRKRKRQAEPGKGKEEEEKDDELQDQSGRVKGGDNPEKWDKMKRAARIIARKRQKRRMRRDG
ncbi:hypothetical protein DRE_00274 [Drechslerella stenobrocha 248]|uniref:RRM domain-containing protein n=1 Tax=Drechslerella stenobrocha 248 TaxID=1043628 RepID=W7HZQ4_9PEZI|nr:hypothetical protein DRE_00274 [Drechslerella stenobrocha 248]